MAKKKAVKKTIVIVGAGNVAWHLAKHLAALKKFQLHVYNHIASKKLHDFKSLNNCKTVPHLNTITQLADYYIVATSDTAIAKVETKINLKKSEAIIMHTSGSVELSALGNRLHNSAVLYPLQTFSRNDVVKWTEVPFIIEADNEAARQRCKEFAQLFSNKIIFATSKERLRLHIAAVMVNNFTNALYAAALDFLNDNSKHAHNIKILLPLIKQTVTKLETLNPQQAQTGPALRGDEGVIEKHLQQLKQKSELKKIYKQLTKLIKKQHEQDVKL